MVSYVQKHICKIVIVFLKFIHARNFLNHYMSDFVYTCAYLVEQNTHKFLSESYAYYAYNPQLRVNVDA